MNVIPWKSGDLPRYGYEDYVTWEGKWELIDGIPYAMVPAPARKHQRLAVKIATQLENNLSHCNRCRTYMPIDWKICNTTVVQPDILVVCDDHDEDGPLETPPTLVFEILSPSTARKDKGLKYRLYKFAGVKYYCIVDPQTNSLDIFNFHHKQKHPIDLHATTITFHLRPPDISVELDLPQIFSN